MGASLFPLLSKSEVATPAAGSYTLFRDKDNGGFLTAKDSNCDYTVLSVVPDDSADAALLCEKVQQVIDDAGCALKKDLMTALEYQSIVDSISFSLVHNIDPFTGSHQIIIQNFPAIFVSLALTHVLCNGDSTGTAVATVTGGTAPLVVDYAPSDPAALAAGNHLLTVTDANGQVKLVSFNITEPAALSAVTSSTPDTGGGVGTAGVVVSGGTPLYTYLWDDPGTQTTPIAVGLAAGNYNVVVTDANGCVLNVGPIVVA